MDYLVGLLLIAGPWIFQFADESSVATWIAVVAGIALVGASMVTDYEGGIVGHLISMPMHLAMDAVVGAFLAVSPWLFGFADQGVNAWLPFVVIGLGEIAAAAMTERTAHTQGAVRRGMHRAH